jgi:xanthosine utilization system XapX-like protein
LEQAWFEETAAKPAPPAIGITGIWGITSVNAVEVVKAKLMLQTFLLISWASILTFTAPKSITAAEVPVT